MNTETLTKNIHEAIVEYEKDNYYKQDKDGRILFSKVKRIDVDRQTGCVKVLVENSYGNFVGSNADPMAESIKKGILEADLEQRKRAAVEEKKKEDQKKYEAEVKKFALEREIKLEEAIKEIEERGIKIRISDDGIIQENPEYDEEIAKILKLRRSRKKIELEAAKLAQQ